jgi:CysZ protein
VRLGALSGLVVAGLGLVPAIGGVVAAVSGFVVAGWLQATGLTAAPLERHGLDREARAALLRSQRWRVLGFGLLVQALFLVPLGAVLVMPAAASGAARLAHGLLSTRPATG